jgi:hypothetical protein
MNTFEIEEIAEESGREECACDFPYLPLDEPDCYRMLIRYGRGRAQGLYQLRGKIARVFAQHWAGGYMATMDIFRREGHCEGQPFFEEE